MKIRRKKTRKKIRTNENKENKNKKKLRSGEINENLEENEDK